MLVYPKCPTCGAPHTGAPVMVRDGEACVLVLHDHGCTVHRYVACFDGRGRQESHTLPDGTRFEDWAREAA